MYAAIRRSRIDPEQVDVLRENLDREIIPRMRQASGARAGYWMMPEKGGGASILLFDTKEQAEQPLPNAMPGEHPAPGVTVESVEVLEVVGTF